MSLNTLGWLVWLTSFTVYNLLWYHWTCLIKIFQTVLMVSSLELRCASRIIFFFFCFFVFSLSSLLLVIYGERGERKSKRKKPWRHTETSMMTPSILLKRSRWDEFNDIKQCHKGWTKRVTQVVQRCRGSLLFRSLVWPTSITVDDLS